MSKTFTLVATNASGSAQASASVTVAAPPSVLPPAGYVVPPNRMQWGEDLKDGPTWIYANHTMFAGWQRLGGDYLDANNVLNGPAHAFSIGPSSTSGVDKVFDVAALVTRLLSENTGFYVSSTAVIPPRLSTRETLTPANAPTLSVTTTAGSYSPPCVADVELNKNSNNCLGTAVAGHTPYLLKFDLSGIVGTVTAASLKVRIESTFGQSQTISVDYLAMPVLIWNPEVQAPDLVQYGIASTVAQDSDLVNHPSVVAYSQFTAATDCMEGSSNWNYISNNFQPFGYISPTYIDWPWYGLHAVRMLRPFVESGDGSTISNAHRLTFPSGNNLPFEKPIGSGPTEMYVRYLMKIDHDVYDGYTAIAGKLPGMDSSIYVSQDPSRDHTANMSARMSHPKQSISNPHLWSILCYMYEQSWEWWSTAKGVGLWLIPNVSAVAQRGHLCVVSDRIHCIEQHIKLNTSGPLIGTASFHDNRWWNDTNTQTRDWINPNVWWNTDGLLEYWIDGVLVHRSTRLIVANLLNQIGSIPWSNFFHGGVDRVASDMHYEWTGVVAATEYIGPPRLIS